jgi:uncharacterized OB-fold protein
MALTERLQNTTDAGFWTGEIPLEYVYTYGRANERFYRSIKDQGTFLGARCDACDVVYVPPRTYCESCFARIEDRFVDVGTKGVVHAFTVLHKNLDGSPKAKPTIMAIVKLTGTDGGLVHYLGEVKPEEVVIGQKVQAVFCAKGKRIGSIKDIKYFKPIV